MIDFNSIRTSPADGSAYRKAYYDGLMGMLRERIAAAVTERDRFMTPEALLRDREGYRQRYRDMLGWPLNEPRPEAPPRCCRKLLERIPGLTLYRLSLETFPGVWFEGLLYVPDERETPSPLAFVLPGGSYCCEEVLSFHGFDSEQYKNMGERFVQAGIAVYVPQLLLWGNEGTFEQPATRQFIDARLKALGGSIAALEIANLMRAVDYFAAESWVDAQRIGVMGLSYGGFYALYFAAADARLKATFSSCFFCDRFGKEEKPGACRPDWLWQGSAHTFFDAEVAALIAPRALYLDGNERDMFPPEQVRREFARLQPFYEAAGAADRLLLYIGEGGHEVTKGEQGFRFFTEHL